METAKVTEGGGGGGGDSNSHGRNNCRLSGIANHIEVRKAKCQIKNIICCTYNGLDGILFR